MKKQLFIILTGVLVVAGASEAAIPKTAGIKAAFKTAEKKPRQLRPSKDLDARVQALYTELMSQPPRVAPLSGNQIDVQIDAANKSDWLQAIYRRNLVDASEQTLLLADKLMMAKVAEQAMGVERAQRFLPKTIGLKEFLDRHHFVSKHGKIKATGEQIEQALYKEFPAGFMVRPAVGVAPTETTKGLFQDSDHFIAQLLEGKFEGYKPEHFWNPVKSHILDAVASGEAVVIQDDIILKAEAQKKLHARAFREIRIHTYEGNVIADAVPTRWVQKAKVTEEETKLAEAFVNEFLKAFPPRILTRQAWGVDVAVFDNGQVIINDIVTNLGRKRSWSSYLEQPRVIGAYTRHFESVAGVRFSGVEGALARNNLGNYFSYWHERIEKAPGGLSRVLSYLPPLP